MYHEVYKRIIVILQFAIKGNDIIYLLTIVFKNLVDFKDILVYRNGKIMEINVTDMIKLSNILKE